jgi:hypothetical protein
MNFTILAYFRTVMGAKGSKVQTVTRDFDVQIKFPDKAGENGEPPAAPRPDRSSNPNIIRITGTCHQSCGSMTFWCGSGSADPCL